MYSQASNLDGISEGIHFEDHFYLCVNRGHVTIGKSMDSSKTQLCKRDPLKLKLQAKMFNFFS